MVLLFNRPALRPLGLFVTAALAVLLGFAGLYTLIGVLYVVLILRIVARGPT